MGALKLTYYEQGALEKNHFLKVVSSDKRRTDLKKVLDYYAGGSIMPGRSGNSNEYRYGWNKGSEKDDEITGVTGAHYTTYFREFDTRLNRTWSIDPMVHLMPWQSPYSSMDNSPIWVNDPMGDKVEPTTEGAKKETSKYGEKTYTNKRGKVKENKNYEPAFGKIYEKWKNDPTILVKFTTVKGKDFGGTIEYEGENEEGLKVYNVMWDPSQTKQLGASGIFEESYHLNDALKGTEMAFPEKPKSGVMGVDIYDEIRAKQWVANNIKSVRQTYKLGGDYYGYTHYGYIKKLNDKEIIRTTLMKGAPILSPIFKGTPGSGTSMGGSYIQTYQPSNFGGKYSTFSPIPKKP